MVSDWSSDVCSSDLDEKGATKDGMKALRDALAAAGACTMGEFLAGRHADRKSVV